MSDPAASGSFSFRAKRDSAIGAKAERTLQRRVAVCHQLLQPRPILMRKLDLHPGPYRNRIAYPSPTGNPLSRSEH
jgi:hypothetical protein